MEYKDVVVKAKAQSDSAGLSFTIDDIELSIYLTRDGLEFMFVSEFGGEGLELRPSKLYDMLRKYKDENF